MATIANNNPLGGNSSAVAIAITAAPTAGTNQVQTLTIGGTPTAGATSNIAFTFQGVTQAALWSATNATLTANILAAINLIPAVTSGDFTVAVGTMTAGVGTITITAAQNWAFLLFTGFTVTNNLTGTSPTATIATGTPGVTATGRGQGPGAVFNDIVNAEAYMNTGTATAPVLTKIKSLT